MRSLGIYSLCLSLELYILEASNINRASYKPFKNIIVVDPVIKGYNEFMVKRRLVVMAQEV